MKQPVYCEFDLAQLSRSPRLIAVAHTDDRNVEQLELRVKQDGVPVNLAGAAVTARIVTVKENYLLSDNVACTVNESGNILIPFDNAVIHAQRGELKIEVNLTRGGKVLTLQFPLHVKFNGSILDDAEITPEAKGTIPELLAEVKAELERVQGYVDEEQVKDIIDGVLSGVTTNIPTLLIDNTVNQQYNPDGHLIWFYIDSDGTRHNLFDFTPYIGGTDNYNFLKNKPSINNVTLGGNKTAADLNLQPILPIGSDNELVDATSRGVIKRSGYRVTTNENVIADRDSANGFVANARATAKAIDAAKLALQDNINAKQNILTAEGFLSIANDKITFADATFLTKRAALPKESLDSAVTGYTVIFDEDISQYFVNPQIGEIPVTKAGTFLRFYRDTVSLTEYYMTFDGELYAKRRQKVGDYWQETFWEKISGGSQIVSGAVDANGHITFTDSDGNTFTTTGASVIGADGTDGINGAGYVAAEINSSGELVLTFQSAYAPGDSPYQEQVNLGRVVGADGAPGQNYVLTAQDKTDIANIVLGELPTTEGVLYGNASN